MKKNRKNKIKNKLNVKKIKIKGKLNFGIIKESMKKIDERKELEDIIDKDFKITESKFSALKDSEEADKNIEERSFISSDPEKKYGLRNNFQDKKAGGFYELKRDYFSNQNYLSENVQKNVQENSFMRFTTNLGQSQLSNFPQDFSNANLNKTSKKINEYETDIEKKLKEKRGTF